MHLKILHFNSGLKMSGAVEKLRFTYFLKQIPPTDSWHQVDSDRCNFHPFMPALTLVSLLERYLVLETAMPRGDIRRHQTSMTLVHSDFQSQYRKQFKFRADNSTDY
jgi:hypothetical protein